MNSEHEPAGLQTGKSPPARAWRFAKRMARRSFFFVVGYVVLVPFIQPWLVRLYANLPFILLALLGAATAFVIYRKKSKTTGKKRTVVRVVVCASWLALLGLAWCANHVGWVVQWQMSRALDVSDLDEQPETENNRLVPRPIGLELIKGDNVDGRLTASTPHVLRTEDNGKARMWWVSPFPYAKTGPVQTIYTLLYGRVLGAVQKVIKVDAKEQVVDLKSGENAFFWFGHDSFITRALFRWRHPFSSEGEYVYWQKPDGSWVFLRSYTGYRMTWTLTMIPAMSGVMEFGSHGNFTNYSVADAALQFNGAPLYPPELTRVYALAYAKFHRGMWNYWLEQKDIYELSEDQATHEHADNHLPYFEDFKGLGLKEYIVFEAIGVSSYAAREIHYVDAVTGKVHRWVPKENSPPLIGPRKALHDVVSADWDMQWQNYPVVEPLIVNGKKGMYYLVFVLKGGKDDHGASCRFGLVNAETRKNNARKFDSSDDLLNFLGEGQPAAPADQPAHEAQEAKPQGNAQPQSRQQAK